MNWKTWLLPLLTEDMRRALTPLSLSGVTEIRLRLGKPMEVVTGTGSRLLYAPNGRPMLREGEQEGLLDAFCHHARYAWEKEIRQGYITLNSGCRVGVAGRILAETGDPAAVLEAKSRGVSVLCTAHGGTFEELMHREGMTRLLAARTFERYVRLVGCGQVEEIRDEEGNRL